MECINRYKASLAAIVGGLTALWGWFGWFCLILAACMALDYLTGTAVARKEGRWSSQTAREGLWHKLAILVAVTVACMLDLVVGLMVNHLPGLTLPFDYSVLFGPLVAAWYILTELGSILENAGALGAPQPRWFKRAVAALQDGIDASGDQPEEENKKE